jgi:predicted XRE-type DNA-binding protein
MCCVPDAEEELANVRLASRIRAAIDRRRLTQTTSAALMCVDQPKVSAILQGWLGNLSCERWMRLLTALGRVVELTISAKTQDHAHGRIHDFVAAYV